MINLEESVTNVSCVRVPYLLWFQNHSSSCDLEFPPDLSVMLLIVVGKPLSSCTHTNAEFKALGRNLLKGHVDNFLTQIPSRKH